MSFPDAATPGSEPDGRDVLVVDDDPVIRAVMVRTLTHTGYTVDDVPDGLDALDLLGRRQYRAFIVDIHMAFVSGTELYEQLRSRAPELAMRVVFVTGETEPAARLFVDRTQRPVLHKPFELEELVAQVGRLVGRPPLRSPVVSWLSDGRSLGTGRGVGITGAPSV